MLRILNFSRNVGANILRSSVREDRPKSSPSNRQFLFWLSEDPYAADVPQLPTSLADAVDALETDSFFRKTFGDVFIDYMVTMKRSEITRYNAWVEANPDTDTYVNGVTDWEHREYFELF